MLGRMRYKTVPLLELMLLAIVTAACSENAAETAYDRGWEYLGQGDYENAIEPFSEAIRLGPPTWYYPVFPWSPQRPVAPRLLPLSH